MFWLYVLVVFVINIILKFCVCVCRLANRVLMVAKQESDNSEDPQFIARVNSASDQVQASKCQRHLCTLFVYRSGLEIKEMECRIHSSCFCVRDITSFPCIVYERIFLNKYGQKLYTFNVITDILGSQMF